MNLKPLLTTSSMTPVERAMGRFMRAPDHPAPAAPAAPAAPEAPAAESAPADTVVIPEAPKPQTTDDLYDAEFGGTVDPEPSEDTPAEEAPAKPEAPAKEEAAPPKETDEVAAARREAEAARAEADRYRREADELRRAQPPKPKEESEQQEDRPAERPNPDDYEFGEADSKFIEDLSEWKANDTFARRQQEADARQIETQTRAEIAEMEANWKEAASSPETLELYPDFNEKVLGGAKADSWKCSPLMTIAIQSSPVGTHVAYELASNAAESERISALSPIEQALEMGRLEGKHLARVGSKEAAPAPANPAVKPSNAPTPPEKRSRGSGGQFASEQDAVYDRMLNEFK